MSKRPFYLTIICWLYIIFSILGALLITLTLENPEVLSIMQANNVSVPLQLSMFYIGATVNLLCSIAILKRIKIGRTLLVISNFVHLLLGFMVHSPTLTHSVILFVLITFLLFRPKVNQYFNSAKKVNT